MPMLVRLAIISFHRSQQFETSNLRLNMPNLKELTISSKRGCLLLPIKADNLEHLHFYTSRVNGKPIVEFLRNFRKLKKLQILIVVFSEMFDVADLDLTLSEFRLFQDSENIVRLKPENLKKFLTSQKSSLTTLIVGNLRYEISIGVAYKSIFGMKRLTNLAISGENFSQPAGFFEDLEPSTSLKTLCLIGNTRNNGAAEGFFKKLPNLERFRTLSRDFTNIVAEFNQRLTHFDLGSKSLNPPTREDLTFQHVKDLSITISDNIDCSSSVITKCPKLERIKLLIFDDGSYSEPAFDATFDAIVNHPFLKHLTIHATQTVLKQSFDKIAANYGNLETLELVRGWRMAKFNFPEDVTEWNMQQQEEIFNNPIELDSAGKEMYRKREIMWEAEF